MTQPSTPENCRILNVQVLFSGHNVDRRVKPGDDDLGIMIPGS